MHEVFDVEHGLTKELVPALRLNLHQAALDSPDAGGADVAVLGGELLGVVTHVAQHGPQVFHVQQQQVVVVGDFEHQVQHPGLGVVQAQHAGQQQRPHVGDGGAHRVTLLAKHIPDCGGAGHGLRQFNASVLEHGGQFFANFAHLADAGQVAFDVGHEDRHPHARKALCQGLQGHGFAGAGGPSDQAVAVGEARQQVALRLGVLSNQHRISHRKSPPWSEK